MKLSIIIPIYNAKHIVSKIINSLLISKSLEFEIICVNDGSTDNTLEILNSFNDSRIKVVTKENGGTFKAWQYGLFLAKGEFVTIVDQDDYVDEDYIDFIIQFIDSHTADLLFTPYYIERPDGTKKYCSLRFHDGVYSGEELERIRPAFCDGRVPYAKFTKVIRKTVLERQVKTTFSGKIHDFEDWLTMIEVFSRVESIYICNHPFYHYIQNSDSVSKSSKSYRKNLESLKSMMAFLENSDYSSLSKESIRSIYFYGLKVVLNKCIKIKEFDLAKEIVNSKQFQSFISNSDLGFVEKVILRMRFIRLYYGLYRIRTIFVKW